LSALNDANMGYGDAAGPHGCIFPPEKQILGIETVLPILAWHPFWSRLWGDCSQTIRDATSIFLVGQAWAVVASFGFLPASQPSNCSLNQAYRSCIAIRKGPEHLMVTTEGGNPGSTGTAKRETLGTAAILFQDWLYSRLP